MKRSLITLTALASLTLASTFASAADAPNFNAAAGSAARATSSFHWATGAVAPRTPFATSADAARAHLGDRAASLGFSAAALDTAIVTHVHDVGRGGIIVTFRQQPNGVEVFHHDAKVLLMRDQRLVAISGGLHAGAVAKPKTNRFLIDDREAIARAFADRYAATIATSAFVAAKTQGAFRFYDLPVKKGAFARAKKVYFPITEERLVAAFFLEMFVGDDAYAYVIAADDGRLLYRENLVHHETFNYRVYADATGDHRPWDGPIADYTPYPFSSPDGSFPMSVPGVMVSIDGFNGPKDPWLPSGATQTKGNNVDCYTDDDSPDGFSSGDIRASVTSPNTFDRSYDSTLDPQANDTQRMASLTDLFYVTNWMHDWWYDSGFDEKAGNAQADNFGRGGVDGDVLRAEGQDGAPQQRDNSNASVPGDGVSPRLQMFVWTGKSSGSLDVTPVGSGLQVGFAEFGPLSFNLTGTVILADDGNSINTNACEPLINNVAGQIVLVDRGACTFKQKAENVEAAGGVGMILANNQPGGPPNMPDADAQTVSIPIESITNADGQAMKTALMNGTVTATMTRSGSVDYDGTLDNTVIAHEWGHYLHLRQVACGNPQCGAHSEGWGDFNSLEMVVRQGDNLDGAYGMAEYATQAFPDDPAYFGIRRYPYSVDMSKNPLTFKHIADSEPLPMNAPVAFSNAGAPNSEVHAAGEIWASMLFEGLIALLKNSQSAAAPYTFDEARRRMSDYVEGGLQLAPTDPTYTEQRDAILATAFAADKNDLILLAQGFARRGAGTCAVSPPRDSFDFEGVVESFDISPNAGVLGVTIDDALTSCDNDGRLDGGEIGNVTISLENNGTATLSGATINVASNTAGVSFPMGTMATIPPMDPFTQSKVTIAIALDPKVVNKKQNLDLAVTVDAPGACASAATLATAPFIHYDEVPMSATVDDVEASATEWTPKGEGAQQIWSISEPKPGNHVWSGGDTASPTDTQLVSPELDVSASDDFVIEMDHRWQFETSMGVFWDGSVIEYAEIGSLKWQDIATITDPGYTGEIGDPDPNGAQNVLRGRQGFVDQNPSFPDFDHLKVNLGKALAGKKIAIRFRIGTDDAAGGVGWALDNVSFGGITNQPFTALVDNQKTCDSGDVITADAGPDQSVPTDAVVTLDGSKSHDSIGAPLKFSWTQVGGTGVKISDADKAKATFKAPFELAETQLTFLLTVDDGVATGTDTVTVTVAADETKGKDLAGATEFGGCGCRTGETDGNAGALGSLAILAMLALRRRRSPGAR